jgi:Carboxypeptidase regulatory-like domain
VNRRTMLRSISIALTALVAAVALTASPSAQARSGAAAAERGGSGLFMSGTVVNPDTGNPVSGVRVTLRDIDTLVVLSSDVTDASGRFRVDHLSPLIDEYAVKVNGSGKGYETGYVGCGNAVVPTWGEACSQGAGRLGRIRLEHL